MSQPKVTFENNQWHIQVEDVAWVRDLSLSVRHQGDWASTRDDQLRAAHVQSGTDRIEVIYHDQHGPCVALRAQTFEHAIRFEAEALRDFKNTDVADSFVQSTFRAPVFEFERDAKTLAYVWGKVDDRKDIPGEDWPHAVFDKSLNSLPKDKAFAPVVVSQKDQSCVISPCSHFMVSPIHLDGDLALARGLSGAINQIKAGLKTQTIMVFGQDPMDTLMAWGTLLRQWGGKQSVDPTKFRLLNKLGYWNAYGAYYAELFKGMDGEQLDQVGKHFNEIGLPVDYIGLDLWYEFDQIGFAKSFRPDPKRFPDDLKPLAEANDKPYWFHLSAFAKDNKYTDKYNFTNEETDGSAYPTKPDFYQDLGRALKSQGAEGIWYDWLFVQQFDVKALRDDPEAADRWYREFVEGFGASGLPVLLCMTTAGFLMGSTQFDNVIASRSYTDYLFKRAEQLKQLPDFGDALPEQTYLIQDTLVGHLLNALGLTSFYDLFISSADHPEGFVDPLNIQEAWRRALSAGIIGFGDKIGCENPEVLWRFMLPDGVLCKPDHHPHVSFDSLFDQVLVAETQTTVDDYQWRYVSGFNVGQSSTEWQFKAKQTETICFDPIEQKVVEHPQTSLDPVEGKYWMFAPKHQGIAVLGLAEKFIPMATNVIQSAKTLENGWRIELKLPVNHNYQFGFFSEQSAAVNIEGADIDQTHFSAGLQLINLKAKESIIQIDITSEDSSDVLG